MDLNGQIQAANKVSGEIKTQRLTGEVNIVSQGRNQRPPLTWTERNTGVTGQKARAIMYGGGVFIAVYTDGTIARSTDKGQTWSVSAIPDVSVSSIGTPDWAYGNGVFVLDAYVGTGSSRTAKFAVSSDLGETWQTVAHPFDATVGGLVFNAVKYPRDGVDGKFVAVGYNSNKAAYSSDGFTWTIVTLPLTADWWAMMSGGRLIILPHPTSYNKYLLSTDGATWTQFAATSQGSAGGSELPTTYAFGRFINSKWGNLPTCYVVQSRTGLEWEIAFTVSPAPGESGFALYAPIGGKNDVVITTDTSKVIVTSDMETYKVIDTPEQFGGGVYGDGVFIMYGYGDTGAVFVSNDRSKR